MSLRPSSYLAVIEEALAEAGRDALVLSALDVQAILDWQRAGIPLSVSLKGIRQGTYVFENTRQPGAAFPRRVSYFAKWVAKLHESTRDRVFAASPSSAGSPVADTSSGIVESSSEAEETESSSARRAFDGLRGQMEAGLASAPSFENVYGQALAELDERWGSLSGEGKGESIGEDLVLHWAFELQAELAERALASLDEPARAELQSVAEAQVRERFPMASASAVATKRRVATRQLLVERHGFVNVDMRELTR